MPACLLFIFTQLSAWCPLLGQWVTTGEQAFKQLAEKNEDALRVLVTTNQALSQKMQALNAEAERQVRLFDTTSSVGDLGKAISAFLDKVEQFQSTLTSAHVGLDDTLHELKALTGEQRVAGRELTSQFDALKVAQQAAVAETKTIATAMSTTAQSIVTVADRLSKRLGSPEAVSGAESADAQPAFDVFLSYSSHDRRVVQKIAKQLETRGIRSLPSEQGLPPGISWQSMLEEYLPQTGSVVICIGAVDTAPWKNKEMRAVLRECVKRNKPVILVLLPDCDEVAPELPTFLEGNALVDFRQPDPDPFETLSWGITGRRISS